MAGEANLTTDHDKIKKWIEDRGGKPSTVKSTKNTTETGILGIDFPGYSGEESLQEISWEEFFKKFDKENLAFLYQDELKSGEESRFFKLVNKNSEEAKNLQKV